MERWTLGALLGDGRIRDALLASADWPLAAWLRLSETAYIVLNAGHILAIGTLLGSVLLLDLRLLGLVGRYPLAGLVAPLATLAALGVSAAMLTGLALFTVRPDAYLANPAFLAKLVLIALAMLNAGLVRATGAWGRALRDGTVRPSLRLAAGLSLMLWPAALLAGRWIGFLYPALVAPLTRRAGPRAAGRAATSAG
jgi:hypothetical protein